MLSPISTKPMSDHMLFSTTCKLYYKSLKSTLPVSFIAVFIFVVLFHLNALFPKLQNIAMRGPGGLGIGELAMISAILLLPWLGVIWLIQIQYVAKKPISYPHLFSVAYQRLLALLGCLISLCLLPAIVLGVLIVSHILFLAWAKTGSPQWFALLNNPLHLLMQKIALGLLLLAILSNKLFAPLLVFSDELNAESAIELSPVLVKHHAIKTYFYHLYGIAIIVLAYALPQIIQYFAPQLKWPPIITLGISIVLVALLLPWTLSFWLVRSWDLKARQGK